MNKIFDIIDKNDLKDCNIIQVGDYGLGFQTIDRDIHNLLLTDEMLIENNINLYILRGNHDYRIFWDKKMGLKLPKFHNLHLVEDHTTKIIEGKNIYFAGGAISIDRSSRIFDNSYDYYEEFNFTKENEQNIIKNSIGLNIDIVVTHSSPDFCYPKEISNLVKNYHLQEKQVLGTNLIQDLQNERKHITKMYNALSKYNKIEKWIYAHFHSSHTEIINNTEFKLLNINELYEI